MLLGERQSCRRLHSSSERFFLATSITVCFIKLLSTSLVSHLEPAIPTIKAPARAPSFRLICSRGPDKSIAAPEPHNSQQVTAETPPTKKFHKAPGHQTPLTRVG